jgi:tRNA threonylcarbamoyladenosine biosynthesis protein TsaB
LKLLAVDGALGAFSVAVKHGDEEFSDRVDGRTALERGLGLVDEVLRRARLRVRDLDALAVCVGPGGFTGLRIAMSYAKGLALAAQRPLLGVSSYDAVEPPGIDPPVVAAVSGRPGLACARLREQTAEGAASAWCGPYDLVTDALAKRLGAGGGREIACCGGVEGVVARLGERGFIVRAYPLPDVPAALSVARIAARRLAAGDEAPPPHALRPDYGPDWS